MKKVGVFTDDFSLYHDIVRALRRRGVAFVSLDRGELLPPAVGVVLTSWGDFVGHQVPEGVPHISVPLDDDGREDVEAGINEALKVLSGVTVYRRLVVGIDPGDRPGLALLGDGVVVHATQIANPEAVAPTLARLLPQYPARERIVRVGHGARLVRNRILNALLPLAAEGALVEVVDETGTSPVAPRQPSTDLARDIRAAIGIANAHGARVDHALAVEPSRGEIADVQRKSREASGGQVTISKALAARVARGEMGLDAAVELQRQGEAPRRGAGGEATKAAPGGRGARTRGPKGNASRRSGRKRR